MKKLGIIYAPRDSASAAALAREVPLYRVDQNGFRSKAGKRAFARAEYILNWGSSIGIPLNWDPEGEISYYNWPEAVKLATSKLKTLTKLQEASIPALEATGQATVAGQWLGQGSTVLCRKDGLSGGRGIVKAKTLSEMVGSPATGDFWVKYWKKTHEYRVHVFKGQVIDIQQKRRRTEWNGNYDPMIRNFDNGWVFCHDGIKGTVAELDSISNTSRLAVAALGLDFGAVDILARFNEDGTLRKHVVCEINTAPGLEGQTLEKYVTAIRSYLTSYT